MDFETLEDSIIAELKTRMPYLRTVESYAGQLERDMDTLPVRFPAVFVAYGGSRFSNGPAGVAPHTEEAAFTALVCASNLRGADEARKADMGAYEAVGDVLGALANNDLGLDIEGLAPVRTALVFSGDGLAVYAVEFATRFEGAYQ